MARKETWMPTAAGILIIVAGAIELFGGLSISALATIITTFFWMPELGALFGVPLIILGIVSIIGGICSLTRKAWGMALAGAICSLFLPHVSILGILAIIFVAISKREFR